jgi:HD superfamily phosphohydrolase YqeK
VRSLRPEHQAFFINPVDIPLIRIATIKRLIETSIQNPDKIIYPVFGRKRGHPPLIPSALIPIILSWQDDGGLKAILDKHEQLTREIIVPDSFILMDMDTPEDYSALLERFRRYEIPTDEEAAVILHDICKVDPEKMRHSYKVADAAVKIGQALNAAGHENDIELVRIADILHDIAKGQTKHDIAGGKVLRDLGFGIVAEVVAVHSDLAGGNTNVSLETKIVYLADKLIEGEKIVSLEERYRSAKRRYNVTMEAQTAIDERLKVAKVVKKDLEDLIGRPLESVIAE